MTDLDKLIEAVETGKLATIPPPHRYARETAPNETARIMGYVEGCIVMRHKGAAPFIETRRHVLDHLRAYRQRVRP